MTDLYPDEEGYIDAGLKIGFCKAAGSITLHGAVTIPATAVTSYISVTAAGVGTGVGIALEAANTNDYIPVVFQGIVKQTVGTATFAALKPVQSSGTTAAVVELITSGSGGEYYNMGYSDATTITWWRLGWSLQAGTTAGDECLIMVDALT